IAVVAVERELWQQLGELRQYPLSACSAQRAEVGRAASRAEFGRRLVVPTLMTSQSHFFAVEPQRQIAVGTGCLPAARVTPVRTGEPPPRHHDQRLPRTLSHLAQRQLQIGMQGPVSAAT